MEFNLNGRAVFIQSQCRCLSLDCGEISLGGRLEQFNSQIQPLALLFGSPEGNGLPLS
jgi:hypothetical protein